jgi:hypothetical protein
MKRFSFIAAAAAAGLLATGCSGVASDLLGDSGAPTEDAGATVDGAAGSDGGIVEKDATASEAGEDATVVDAAPDVHVGPADSKIQCGPQLGCSAQNEICCWHMASSVTPYECVSSIGDCSGTYDVPMTCSSTDNCASQGNDGYQCCATTGNYGMGQCYGYDVATVVACKPSCDVTDTEIGCSVQQQNCSDPYQTCIVSKCTAPGDTMCY